MQYRTLCFTGGGSGGHVYPAKPLIDHYRNQGCRDIHWIGSSQGLENSITSSWDVSYKAISTGKLRRYFSMKNISDIFRIIAGFFQARRYLKRIKPDFLFSKGGFVSVPPVYAARSLGIPVYSHDSDMDPGLATRLNSRCSRKIFIPYQESMKYYRKWSDKISVVGNPVRSVFFHADKNTGKDFIGYKGVKPILLVMGGSLGAQEINKMVESMVPELCKHFFVVHQTGNEQKTSASHENYRAFPYIHNEMPHVLKASSLALSRAGANSLWELAATGTPMVLWPLTTGSRGDQPKNAELFKQMGFAQVVDGSNLTQKALLNMLIACAPSNREGQMMAEAIQKNPLPNAEKIIVKAIEEDNAC